jgi:hypothetical protein
MNRTDWQVVIMTCCVLFAVVLLALGGCVPKSWQASPAVRLNEPYCASGFRCEYICREADEACEAEVSGAEQADNARERDQEAPGHEIADPNALGGI